MYSSLDSDAKFSKAVNLHAIARNLHSTGGHDTEKASILDRLRLV